MRQLTRVGVAAVVLLAACGLADAQINSRVIDTNALVIKPVEATTNIVGQTFRFISRITADTIDNSQILRTVNTLFGTRPKAAPTQFGLSPLPDPSTYPSTYYRSQIQPMMPTYQVLPRR